MTGLSISFGRLPDPTFAETASARGAHRGLPWMGQDVSFMPDHLPSIPRHGCVVVRRLTDDLGREWRVRQLWSENCHGLLFQCMVPGIRSEVRPMPASLESLTDDDLLSALAPADD